MIFIEEMPLPQPEVPYEAFDICKADGNSTIQVPTGQGLTIQGPTGQDPTGQGPTGQNPTGQGPTGQDPTQSQGTGAGEKINANFLLFFHFIFVCLYFLN